MVRKSLIMSETGVVTTLELYGFANTILGKIGKGSITNKKSKMESNQEKIILILDTSGSMGQLVIKVISAVHDLLLKQGYKSTDTLSIITFDSCVKVYESQIRNMCYLGINSGGSTNFSEVPNHLYNVLTKNREVKQFNILCISDGEIFDQEKSMTTLENMKKLIPSDILCNVCSIRLFSSTFATPDTRTLVGVSQLDNSGKLTKLNEIKYGDSLEIIGTFMSEHFTIGNIVRLESLRVGISTQPCGSFCKSIILSNEETWIYFDSLPYEGELTIDNISLSIMPMTNLTLNNYLNVLDKVFSRIDNEIRTLKIVNTKESQERLKKILEFLSSVQSWELEQKTLVDLQEISIDNLSEYSLLFKRRLLKKKVEGQQKTVINRLQELINNDNISKLNANQKAEFLRNNVEVNAQSKRLVRLGGVNDNKDNTAFDLNERIRIEVKNICSNISKLDEVDASLQETSFFSQETCVESLRQLNQVLPYLNDLDAADIFQLINIVGIGAYNPRIQEYPDTRLWKPSKLYPSCNTSMCDIIMYHTMKKKSIAPQDQYDFTKGIPVPGFPNEFMNCAIPVFSDQRVLNFLYTNAPTILEIINSINIMRLVIDVPDSYYYVTANGCYKLLQDMCNTTTELHYTLLMQLIKNINQNSYVGNYRKLFLKGNPTFAMTSYYGVTNTIVPVTVLLTLSKDYYGTNPDNISKLLRATYNFEIYHRMRGLIKHLLSGMSEEKKLLGEGPVRQELINDILGITNDKMINVGEPLTDDPEFTESSINFNDIVDTLYDKYENELSSIKYLVMIPNIICGNIDSIKESWINVENNIVSALGINYVNYKHYCCHQMLLGLIHGSQSERVDHENKIVHVPEFMSMEEGDKYFTNYVNNKYFTEYNRRIAVKHAKEVSELSQILADTIIQENDEKKIYDLFRDGLVDVVRGVEMKTKFVNEYSEGVSYLLESLLDPKLVVPKRVIKIKTLILGVDANGTRVWNGENIIKGVKRAQLEPFFEKEEFEEYMSIYMVRRVHTYRESGKPNNNGYSRFNPSFYGLGYMTILDFVQNAPKEEVADYLKRNSKKNYNVDFD